MKDGIFMYIYNRVETFCQIKSYYVCQNTIEVLKSYRVGVNIIANRFNVGIFNMCKYVDIIVDIIIFKDKLFSHFIFMFHDL